MLARPVQVPHLKWSLRINVRKVDQTQAKMQPEVWLHEDYRGAAVFNIFAGSVDRSRVWGRSTSTGARDT